MLFRSISGIFISVEFSRILGLVESSGFLRCRVDISRNLRLVDLGRFPRFYFRFKFRAVYCGRVRPLSDGKL